MQFSVLAFDEERNELVTRAKGNLTVSFQEARFSFSYRTVCREGDRFPCCPLTRGASRAWASRQRQGNSAPSTQMRA